MGNLPVGGNILLHQQQAAVSFRLVLHIKRFGERLFDPVHVRRAVRRQVSTLDVMNHAGFAEIHVVHLLELLGVF